MKLIYGTLMGALIVTLTSCSRNFGESELKNDVDSLSYFLGVFTGHTMKESGYTAFNEENFDSAVQHIFKGEDISEWEYIDWKI